MTGWTVSVEVTSTRTDTAADQAALLMDLLAPWGAAFSVAEDGTSYGATLSVEGPEDALGAAQEAVRVFAEAARRAGVEGLRTTGLEVMTWEQHDQEVAPLPDSTSSRQVPPERP